MRIHASSGKKIKPSKTVFIHVQVLYQKKICEIMKTKFILFAVLFSTFLKAQDSYSYISDRRFYGTEDLIGYDFRPDHMEIPEEWEEALNPGTYSFGISNSNLYVNGGEIKGVYSVNNINPTEYGYKLILMNARDPTLQGHLKVVLNKYAQVEALVFKRSTKEKEIIFFQAQMKEELWEEEKKYFTYKFDCKVSQPDSIWGQKFYPFLRIHFDEDGVQERLQMNDSTSIEFIERVTVIEKKKNGRKKNKDVIEERVLTNVDGVILEADAGAYPPVEVENDTLSEQKEAVKVKIVKEYFAIVRSVWIYEDGTSEDKSWEIQLKRKFTEYERKGPKSQLEPIEFVIAGNKKGKDVSIFLTKKGTVSSISVLGKKYLMRGN